MTVISIAHINEQYALIADKWVCMHINAYTDRACCPPGTDDCGCKGRDRMVCPNIDCTGIEDDDVDDYFGQEEDCNDI